MIFNGLGFFVELLPRRTNLASHERVSFKEDSAIDSSAVSSTILWLVIAELDSGMSYAMTLNSQEFLSEISRQSLEGKSAVV